MNRLKTGALIVLLALVALFVVAVTGGAAPAAGPVPNQSYGRLESCTLDSTSSCTKPHGLGVKPTAVLIQVVAPGQQPNVVSADATNYRVKFLWRTGVGFKAGTVIKFYVHFDVPGVVPPTPSPSPTTTTTTTKPPTTPPPTTVPPSGCPADWFHTVSTSNAGERGDVDGGYFLHNDTWNNHTGGNNGPVGRYEMCGDTASNWYELVTQADSPTDAVRAYPKVGRDYDTPKPLTQISESTFSHVAPTECAGCAYNFAYDIWINYDLENELMIWTQYQNQTPAGEKVDRVTFNGKAYDVWKTDDVTTVGGIFTYVSVVPQTSGVMPLGQFFQDLEHRGWILHNNGATDGTLQVNYGVEVVTTANTQKRFEFKGFTISEM